ncbi:regulatory protein [Lysobacter ruishenii]|uniref:Regulatory protein RecX n=2 Tax=Aerolutibacter ruishenii TaxID=686800 RepID=A0A562LI37_9GAMM|nr:regulatory protein [Lysobacter ruishenii]
MGMDGNGDEGAPPPRARRKRAEPTPVQRAIGLLSRREHSRRELTRKLKVRGVEDDAAKAAVGRLAHDGWQDDARFAESLVRSRSASGYGPLHIRAELGTHGLDRDAVAAAMDTFDGDWAANARDLVRRRYGTEALADIAARRKAADLLARRGFDVDTIRSATRYDPDDAE